MSSTRRILILNLTRFGDLLQTSPTVAVLRERHPDAHITFLAERNFAEVCDGIPGIDRVRRIDLDRVGNLMLEGGDRLLEAYRYIEEEIRELREERFDLAFNFSSSRMSAVFMGLLRIPDVRGWSMTPDGFRVILNPWSRLFATMCLNRRFACFNLVDYYRWIADGGPGPRRLLYEVAPAAEERVGALLQGMGVRSEDRLVAFQLGASRAIRRWPTESFAEVARSIAADGHRPVLIGGGGDAELAVEVASRVGPAAIDACGKTDVGGLGALLRRARLLITGDTGPMHMAAAVATPIVGLFFGPALPQDTGPYGEDHLVLHAPVPCSPCEHSVTCLDPFCRTEITPAQVAAAARGRLARDWSGLAEQARRSPLVRFHRTGFDRHDAFACERLDGREDEDDRYRWAYRAIFQKALAGVPLPSPRPFRASLEPFAELAAMAREGEAIAVRLAAGAVAARPSLDEMSRLGREIEALDAAIATQGGRHPETAVLSQMFRFGKENIEGDEVQGLARATRELYRELLFEAEGVRSLLTEPAPEERGKAKDASLHQ
jgi:ADP-heptose:LPS heptosyltransferase